jgi:MFS family permease
MKFRIPGFSSQVAAIATGVDNERGASRPNQHSTDAEAVTEKDANVRDGSSRDYTSDDASSLEKIDTNAEHGVQTVQAMTQVWSKRDILITYVLIWLIQFLLAFTSGIVSTLTPYVTSSFQEHSLTALTGVISSLIAGIWKLPYAKIINVWGRAQGLTLMVLSITIGLIMMAACNNVQTYCAAMVFYYVGYNGVDFSITVFIADSSKLKNRAFLLGYVSSPWLITTWVYGYAASSILSGVGFRWGFGIFAIVVPIVCSPLVIIFWLRQRDAIKADLVPTRNTAGMPLRNKITYYLKEFDVAGLLILATGLALFLLAFNIYSYQPNTWRSPLIISFIIIGFFLIIAFGIYEARFAPITFVPWPLLKNRTVIFTYTMAASLYIGFYIWDSYFYSLNIVLFNQSVVHATYINNIYTLGSCLCSIVYGLSLRTLSGRLKWYAFTLGVPLTILGVGLMIHFRQPDMNIGYIVMCMLFVAFGGGILVISEQTTLMAVSKQRDFPALLACESMVIAIGSAIGQTIAGAMWTGIFPAKLRQNLPPAQLPDLAKIYGDIDVQSGFAWGSDARNAVNLSYGETQKFMLIAATAIYAVTWASVLGWQDVDVRKMKQRSVGLL